MSQSLSKLSVHIVFHVKYNSIRIKKEDRNSLYAYINEIIRNCQSIPIVTNGTENHIHILCVMSKNIALKDLVNKIKSNSSRWLRMQKYYENRFHWQGGYGCFAVSESQLKRTKRYIYNQEAHHRKLEVRKEYILLLDKHQIDYDQPTLWES